METTRKDTCEKNSTNVAADYNHNIKYRTIDNYLDEAVEHAPKSFRLYYWFMFISMGLSNMGDSTEIACMNYVLSDKDFIAEILHNDVKRYGALLASTIFAGMLIGGVVTGVLGDQIYGRRRILLTGLIINSMAGMSSALAPSLQVLCLARFTSGLGIGAILSSLITLTTELSPSSQRGMYVSFVASFWTVGSITVAILGYSILGKLELGWRVFLACCALPSFVGCGLVAVFVPESPRFLAIRGDFERAAHEANIIAIRGIGYRKGNPLRVDELEHHFSLKGDRASFNYTSSVTRKKLVINAVMKIRNLYGYGLRRKTIPLHVLWFTLSFGSGICTWISTIFAQVNGITDVYLGALFFAVANVPGNVAAAIFLDKFGRRKCFAISVFGSVFSLVCFAQAVYQPESNPATVVGFACAFHCFLVGCWCSLSCMTGEMLPTNVRGTGMGMCSAAGRVAAILAQFTNGTFVDKPALVIIIAAVMMSIGGLTPSTFKMEELSRQHLEDDLSERNQVNESIVTPEKEII